MSQHFQYLKEGLTIELVTHVMYDYQLDLVKALDVVYSAEILEKYNDPTTGLYTQSAAYVYSFLKDELTKGKFNA